MMKKDKKKEEEVFFVGLKEPIEVRRNLLEASREMVLLLQMYEKFKTVREEKKREMEKLRGDIRDIALLVSRLKRHLPKTKLRALPLEEIKKEEHKKERIEKPVPEKAEEEKAIRKEITEIEKLEAELASIEMKLNKLA